LGLNNSMINVFLLTYNEQYLWCDMYHDDFVNKEFKPNNINFVVLDNGNQPKMREWCEKHNYIYYASEYNIGSAGGYNWIFKVAFGMGLSDAVLMQADVECSNALPLLITHQQTKLLGDTHFVCWPQTLRTPWDFNLEMPYVGSENEIWSVLYNLGNVVGFNPKRMYDENCYFDDNFVVTHYDDIEFVNYCHNCTSMQILNVARLLGLKQGYNEYHRSFINSFLVESPKFAMCIRHASMTIERQQKKIINSHGIWETFNKPYYDMIEQKFNQKNIEFGYNRSHYQRMPYDPNRWIQHGYLPYPTEFEIDRFFNQFPHLKQENIVHKYL